jgi:hypothetical protein
MLSVRVTKGGRPDSNRYLRGSQPRMLTAYTTATTNERGRPDSNRRPLA